MRLSKLNHKGFTLLEILIVAGIIAAVVSIASVSMSNRNAELRDTVRLIGTLARNTHNMARLKGKTYRLVIDMQSGEDSEYKHKYWVESSNKAILLSGEASTQDYVSPEEAKENKLKENDKTPNPEAFSKATDVLKGEIELDKGLVFRDVEIFSAGNGGAPITSGRVYIHFLPQGYVEESAIHLAVEGEDIQWTVAIHPLTGKTDIMSSYVSLKDIRDQ